MAYEESLRSVSLNADASLAGYTGVPGLPGSASPNDGKALFRFVKVTGKNTVGLATGVSDRVIGVCQNKPQVTGQAATVGIRGITNVVADGSHSSGIDPGDPVTTDSEGRAVLAESSDFIYGVALTGTSTEGVLISVLLTV